MLDFLQDLFLGNEPCEYGLGHAFFDVHILLGVSVSALGRLGDRRLVLKVSGTFRCVEFDF